MNRNIANVQDVFLDRVNLVCAKFGLNNIMTQLYAILYLSNKPLSLDDMTERLKVSKGSASINIRELERYNAVRKIWVKGSRRDYYEAEPDISKVIIERVRSMARGRLSELDDMIQSSYEALNAVEASTKEEKESIRAFKQKLDELRKLQSKAQAAFNLINSRLLSGLLKIKSKRKEPARI